MKRNSFRERLNPCRRWALATAQLTIWIAVGLLVGDPAQGCGPNTGPFTCPPIRCYNRPMTFDVAIDEWPDPVPPSLIDICPSPPSPPPCIVPPSPLLDTGVPAGAQEMTFKAVVPTEALCPEFITWRVEWKNGATWNELYSQHSIDSRRNEFTESGQLMSRFGAPGLKPGKEHRVSVAYSCGVTPPEFPNSTCFSDPAYDGTHEDGSPKGFIPPPFAAGNSLPKIPPEFIVGSSSYQEMEDSFLRPSTLSKRSPTSPQTIQGDGLGPDSVWLDSNPYQGAGNGSRVVAGAGGNHFALLPQAAMAQYAVEATNSHSFVEVPFGRNNATTDVVNFELHARQFLDGATLRSYFVKFLENRYEAGTQPDIVIASPACQGLIDGIPETYPPGWVC